MAYIQVINECKRYRMGESTIVANNNINFEIEKGEFVIILGPSGAGKSTVLNILGGMDSIDETLKLVGLEHRKNNFPAQLSGGEQQRVAIARAIAKNPKLLLCDEPTGALDYTTGKQILKTLQDTCRNTGTTVIVITHNSALAPMADRVIRINDAKVRSIEVNSNPSPVETIEW